MRSTQYLMNLKKNLQNKKMMGLSDEEDQLKMESLEQKLDLVSQGRLSIAEALQIDEINVLPSLPRKSKRSGSIS